VPPKSHLTLKRLTQHSLQADPVSTREVLSTHQKALQINLDAAKYGTFSEIGAGQEVARWFFRVGAAAGTIAKSISAYDMTFSDAIYGPSERYVSRQRLQAMLAHEYDLLIERLDGKRGASTSFFTFADTVAARNFHGTNECHGWLGVRFQSDPKTEPNDIIMHVRMLDRENVQQQEALGMVGVNLAYGAFYFAKDPYLIIESLLDNLTTQRIEVDMVKFSGPLYQGFDSRLASLHLITTKLTDAVMFAPDGEILQPSEALYKKAILLERGHFRPVTKLNLDMLERARVQFLNEPKNANQKIIEILEITMNNLLEHGHGDPADILQRVDVIGVADKYVMVSSFGEFHRLGAYLNRYTKSIIGLVLGVPLLSQMFEEKYYENLEGGILEGFGRLFKNDLRLYAYPGRSQDGQEVLSTGTLKVVPHLRNLYQHLITNQFIQPVNINMKEMPNVGLTSRDVSDKIVACEPGWETFVLPRVAHLIKERGFFGCQKQG
jgi:hypothetical protein